MARAPRPPRPSGQARPSRPRPPSPARVHVDWLRLVEVSGPFLSIPALLRVFPQGLPRDEATSQLRKDFRVQLDGWEEGHRDPATHQAFIRFVLERVLEWPAAQIRAGQALPPGLTHQVAEHGETLRPDFAVVNPAGHSGAGKARVLVLLHPPDQDLERTVEGHRWKASPATRAMHLCHAVEVPLALVTNGAEWTLVHARRGETTTYATFNAPLFVEEPGLFDAFRALLDRQRLFGVADADGLEALLAESASNQQEVTDQLGLQVRHAVEVLVQAIDKADRASRGAILRDVPERVLYEAAVGVMMRLVFTLAAEERKLLPYGDPLYDAHYSVSTLLAQLQEVADKSGVEVLERRFAAWARLLASFRAVHGGVDHDRLRLPAYGGSLFDPDRYPFLEGRVPGSKWREVPAKPVLVSDRTVYHLLNALQMLELSVPGGGKEARRLSFRALDVEQIGHVYEGLLDHTAVRATEPVLGLVGAKGEEPEVALSSISMAAERGESYLVEFLEEQTRKSEASLRRAIAGAGDADLEATARLLQACGNDEKLRDVVAPWAKLLREDEHGFPIVIQKGSVYVTAGSDRRSTGTHYTPRSLTEPVVQYALEPQVYRGPAEGWPREKWQLKSPRELLALRVCDMAMGSGAFLAQACRWLGDRLVEAWEEAEANAEGKLVVTPEGDLASGAPGERPLPRSAEERIALARRAVAERCLYGVDVNPMAVEIAKLSLWLVTLQKDRPFTFVDHALRCGDSLLGVTSPEQIAFLHLDPEQGKLLHQNLFNWTAACEPALKRALEKRRKLESFTVESAHDAEEKARLLTEAESVLTDLRLVADALIGSALTSSEQGDQAYSGRLVALSVAVSALLDPEAQPADRDVVRTELAANTHRLLNQGKPIGVAFRRPFHWALEFPEVIRGDEGKSGFDAVAGNPPFRGGTLLSRENGRDYLAYLKKHFAGGGDRADIHAYFLARTIPLTPRTGTVSLVAPNSITDPDTRRASIEQVLVSGGKIYRATSEMKWPGAAGVTISLVAYSRSSTSMKPILDGRPVGEISAVLSSDFAGDPFELMAKRAVCGLGAKAYGEGFLLGLKEGQDLLRLPGYEKIIRPFVGGEDIVGRADRPFQRYAIYFGELTLEECRVWPIALDILADRVRSGREKDDDSLRRTKWWQFERHGKEVFGAVSSLRRCLVTPEVAKYLIFAWRPVGTLVSHGCVVVADESDAMFALLQSSIHEVWGRRPGQTKLETRPRYNPATVFRTFPLPGVEPMLGLRDIGLRYEAQRTRAAVNSGLELTDLYNALHSRQEARTEIVAFRALAQELDMTVAAAFGWSDLDLGHDFHETRQGVRFTISESARREVLARLLKLNHERYAEEVKQGLHEPGRKGKGGGKGGGKVEADGGGPQGSLF